MAVGRVEGGEVVDRHSIKILFKNECSKLS